MSLNDLTYFCELDRLDENFAHFKAGEDAVLTIKRSHWHTIGRPTSVSITPTGDPCGRNR